MTYYKYGKLVKEKVGKLQADVMQIVQLANLQNLNLMKWQVDEVASLCNGMLMKWQVDEMAG